MAHPLRIARTLLGVALVAGLLGSGASPDGEWCRWVCQAEVAPASSPERATDLADCHAAGSPGGPASGSSHPEGCTRCGLHDTPIPPPSVSLEAAAHGSGFASASVLPAAELPARLALLPRQAIRRLDRSPPLDVLAITSSLRL